MLREVLVLFLLFLCVLICAAFAAVGFFAGTRVTVLKKEKPPDLDERGQNLKKKAERELKNFLEYSGDQQ